MAMQLDTTPLESQPDRDRSCAELIASAGLYALLGRCLESEVDEALLGALRGELREPLGELGLVLDAGFYEADSARVLAELAEEFTGLFVAPGGVSPYASVFETGRMFQEPADHAERAYREAGWSFHRRLSGEFADHIGTMLGFVAALYEAEAQALEQGDGGQADTCRARRERFVIDQLGRWAVGWCRRARTAAIHDFYRGILALTEAVLWDEVHRQADRKMFKQLAVLNQRPPVRLDYDADFRKASGL